MRKRILAYRKRIDDILSGNTSNIDYSKVLEEHLVQIGFFSHERLVHLIVTVTFAILTMISIAVVLIAESLPAMILTGAFLVLLIPYVFHYYLLENEVQKMYYQYDEIIKRMK